MRLRTVFGTALCLALAGCYTLQAVRGQWEVLGARRSLAAVRADPATDPRTAQSLAIAAEARDLTRAALGLRRSGSYSSFVRLPREWPVWNVIVAPEFAVEPRPQCFALIGCLAYRGFFAEADAHAWAERARARGDDVFVAPVPAYSTLGWFDDPVMWSMLRWDDATLAGFVAHELAHEALYTGDDTAFDEAFAETVAAAVVQRMFTTPERADLLTRWRRSRQVQAQSDALRLAARGELAVLYASTADVATLRTGKRVRLERLTQELSALASGLGSQRWDNARLALTATYAELVPGFTGLLAEADGDLGRFRTRVAELAHQPPEVRRAALAAAAQRAVARVAAERASG